MAVECNKPTPKGPCTRPVATKGAPCGVNHATTGTQTVAPPAGAAGVSAADPFATPETLPAEAPAPNDPQAITADLRASLASHLGVQPDQLGEPSWAVVFRDGKPSLSVEFPGVDVTTPPGATSPSVVAPVEPAADAPTGVMLPVGAVGPAGGEPLHVAELAYTGDSKRTAPLTWDRIGYNAHSGDMTVWTSEGYRIRYGEVSVHEFDEVVSMSRIAGNRADHHQMVQPGLDECPVVSHDLPLDKGVAIKVSSATEGIEYDPTSQRLHVSYARGKDGTARDYTYHGVTHDTFVRLVGSTSRGRFINDRIRKHYPTQPAAVATT